jgi:hypothetical protein
MEQCLALFWTAVQVSRSAMSRNLATMATNGFPTFDLTLIFIGNATSHVVSTVPLKPSARIVFVYPALFFQTDNGWLALMPK